MRELCDIIRDKDRLEIRSKTRENKEYCSGDSGECRLPLLFLHKISTRIFNVGGKLAVVAQKFTLS